MDQRSVGLLCIQDVQVRYQGRERSGRREATVIVMQWLHMPGHPTRHRVGARSARLLLQEHRVNRASVVLMFILNLPIFGQSANSE